MLTRNRRSPVRWTLGFFALVAGPLAAAQEVPVVSSEVAVSSEAAALRLELRSGEDLEITFRGGTVRIDDSEVGSYRPGDVLETAWRDLLGETLAATLRERLDPPTTAPVEDRAPALAGQDADVLRALLFRTDRLRQLTGVLDELQIEQLSVHVGENVLVAPDEVVDATLVVVDGDLEILGTVQGHAIVLGGTVELGDEGRVAGDLRWMNGNVRGDRAIVAGSIEPVEDLRARIESEVRDELQRALPEARRPARAARDDPLFPLFRGFRPLANVVRGMAGLIQTAVTFVVLLLIAALALAFFPRHVNNIAATARREPGRAALVGVAGFVLFFPVWILGIVGLAISLIGIPLLLGWIPLFPVAVLASCLVGFIAVAHVAGGWLEEHRYPALDWMEEAKPLHRIGAGLGLFLVAFAAASVVQMAGPWLGFLRGLLIFVGTVAVVAAVTVGFGAVLLSRAGRLDTRSESTMGATGPAGAPEEPAGGKDPFEDEVREWEREFRSASGHGESASERFSRERETGTATAEEPESGDEGAGPAGGPEDDEGGSSEGRRDG